MKDELEGKTLEELKELEQQLTGEIDVMDQMRDRQNTDCHQCDRRGGKRSDKRALH